LDDEIANDEVSGIDPWAAAVRDELTAHEPVYSRALAAGMTLTVQPGLESIWIVVRGSEGGGIAFRTAYAPGALTVEEVSAQEQGVQVTLQAPSGKFEVLAEVLNDGLLHWTTTLTPKVDLTLPFSPRDVYPLDGDNNPIGAHGTAHAGQPAAGASALFLTQSEPVFGSALYLQNFSALSVLFETLGTRPLGLVGGQWPQFGFALPASETPLPANQAIVVSDAFVCVSAQLPKNERDAARLYLDSLAAIYPHLPQRETQWRDWPARAADSLVDLAHGDGCLVTQNGFTYARPYVGAEEPDSMVQLALTLPLVEYSEWTGKPVPLAEALRAGVPAFYDADLGAMRRYLPDAPEDKDRNESDSWYLYHPLLDLGRLAKRGDDEARRLLFGSLEHAIWVAHHFEYRWPVKFHLETLDVLTGVRKPNEPGQSDVGGIYAAVMIEAWDLSGDERYLNEAKAAIRALTGYRFAVGYQFNITAIGAAACLRLWQATGDDFFRDQSLLLLAAFFQHTTFYDCHLGTAKFFPAFLGVLCLHDAEYTAVFEAFEAFAAFHQMFEHAGDDLPDTARLLITEYCRHLLDRAWYYYPGELPQDALAKEVRNGRLDQSLAVPMEDLYPIGDPAGQVGQEVYGAGAAFAFATRAFRTMPDAPFQIACGYPTTLLTTAANCAALRVHGFPSFSCRLKLISSDGSLPPATVYLSGQELPGSDTAPSEREYAIPGGSDIEVRW
jgi:hypothetical protein